MIDIRIIDSPKGVLLPEGEFEKILEERDVIRRALWLARAMRAKEKYTTYMHFWDGYDEEDLNFILWKKWQWVERKCRQKAEEFK